MTLPFDYVFLFLILGQKRRDGKIWSAEMHLLNGLSTEMQRKQERSWRGLTRRYATRYDCLLFIENTRLGRV